jgi:hypothetical protein
VQYVAHKLGYFRGVVDDEPLGESTYRRHRQAILDYLGWQSFNSRAEAEMIAHIHPRGVCQGSICCAVPRFEP